MIILGFVGNPKFDGLKSGLRTFLISLCSVPVFFLLQNALRLRLTYVRSAKIMMLNSGKIRPPYLMMGSLVRSLWSSCIWTILVSTVGIILSLRMAGPKQLWNYWGGIKPSHRMALDLQQRAAQHGHKWDHTRYET